MRPFQALPAILGLATAIPHDLNTRTTHANTTHGAANITKLAASASSWWYANIDHASGPVRDYAPGVGDSNYPIYKSVSNVNDLYSAILSNGPNGSQRPNHPGSGDPSSDIIPNDYLASLPRVIYIQPGTYVLNSKLVLTGDTILIGDAVQPPVLQASSGFSDPWVIQGGSGTTGSGHGELRFSRMIKNIVIDTTQATGNSNLVALEWGVAQNCALVNIQINMAHQMHTGLLVQQGSTVQVADVSFSYGNVGISMSNQQATFKNMKFVDTTTGILITGGFTVNVLSATFDTVGTCVQQTDGTPWLSIVDATLLNSGVLLRTVQYPNFMLENISRDNTNPTVIAGGNTVLGSMPSVGHYVYGNTVGKSTPYVTNNSPSGDNRPSSLLVNGKYLSVKPSQHTDKGIGQVINLKDSSQNGGFSVKGDGSTIDLPGLQSGINLAASSGKIAYLPYGIYRVDNTLTLPKGTILIGNGWSAIEGIGSNFKDQSNPRAIVQVGNPNDVGTAEIQDIRVSAGEQLPGAILVKINMAGKNPGDVVFHNSLITLGGTVNTGINCGGSNDCAAAYIGLHLTSTSSAAVNNVWVWVADHPVDNSNLGARIAGKGGVLVEATKGTWLTGLGSEHWWYYNLGFNQASNVFVSMLQSETNYHEGGSIDGNSITSNPPTAPFTPTSSDPNWGVCGEYHGTCTMTMNQWVKGGSNIFSYGSASWNFGGSNNVQDQVNVIEVAPSSSHWYGMCAGPNALYAVRLPSGQRYGNGQNDGFTGSWQTLIAELSF